MARGNSHYVLWLACLALQLSAACFAQQPVARIRSIADISSGQAKPVDGATDRIKIQRQFSCEWDDAAPNSDLFWRDRLLLQRYIRAAIEIQNRDQRGALYVLPELLQTYKARALYEIREQAYELGDVELVITHGSLVIDWAHGKLSVIAVGIRALLNGTRVAFIVDYTRASALIFLDHGSVIFPDYPGLQQFPSEVYRLRLGEPPVRITLPAGQTAELHRFVQVNSKGLWSKPRLWWQKPGFYLPAAAVAGGGIVAGIMLTRGNGEIPGQVIIRIPD